jgi:predicted nucleic acid-binding protein
MTSVSDSKIFIDTNILYYTNDPNSSFGHQAISVINALYSQHNRLFISTQVLKEYANATLRDAIYHKLDVPNSISIVARNIKRFQRDFELLYDTEDVLEHWLALLPKLKSNKDIFDYNILATLQSNDIHHILTNNEKDFLPFQDNLIIIPLFPKE